MWTAENKETDADAGKVDDLKNGKNRWLSM